MVHLLEKSQERKYIYRKAAYKCNCKWTVFTRKVGLGRGGNLPLDAVKKGGNTRENDHLMCSLAFELSFNLDSGMTTLSFPTRYSPLYGWNLVSGICLTLTYM